ncbi:hypothetical protein Sjap_025589 [Stephania japonica]|uniref:Uncharacterized protein n=1 Tax=Stephania japonica TaxID=461633 RepID=A0AAP0E9R3_9MAGN
MSLTCRNIGLGRAKLDLVRCGCSSNGSFYTKWICGGDARKSRASKVVCSRKPNASWCDVLKHKCRRACLMSWHWVMSEQNVGESTQQNRTSSVVLGLNELSPYASGREFESWGGERHHKGCGDDVVRLRGRYHTACAVPAGVPCGAGWAIWLEENVLFLERMSMESPRTHNEHEHNERRWIDLVVCGSQDDIKISKMELMACLTCKTRSIRWYIRGNVMNKFGVRNEIENASIVREKA